MANSFSSSAKKSSSKKITFKQRMTLSVCEVKKTSSIAGAGLLCALGVALNQATFAVSTMLEIGFSFLANAMCAFLYGPIVGVIAAIAMDFAGYFLRPNGGFFIGFTLNEVLCAIIYGFWLYKKPVKIWRAFMACLTVVIVINLILTPMWLNFLYGNAQLISNIRLIKNAIKLPVDTAILYGVLLLAKKIKKQKNA